MMTYTKKKEANQNMDYNSDKELLRIPEYGRNVQNMIEHARTIEDREMRQAFVEKVVDLMMQMSPQNKNLDDFRDKLWKHVFRIGDYALDVDTPSGVTPTPEDKRKKPDIIPYPVNDSRFRHYGNNVMAMVAKARAMEEGPVRDGFVSTIGSYMKMAYRTWNKEHYISDEIIINDLKTLSNGELIPIEDASLDSLSNSTRRRKRPDNQRRDGGRDSRGGRRDNRSNGGGGRGGRRDNRSGGGGGRGRRY